MFLKKKRKFGKPNFKLKILNFGCEFKYPHRNLPGIV